MLAGYAQNAEERYRAIYDEAENNYNIGRLDEAIQSLKSNLKGFPISLKTGAYRILSLSYLGEDNEMEAEYYARQLLDENPYYSTTPSDPQRFIDMIESIKSGRTATITTASSQAENLNEVPVPTTLITEEMIRNSCARNLQEVLATYVPGMNIVDCNDDINVAMRGIFSNGQEKILIMLNGHRLNSFATNIAAPDFSISLDKVKQIEVLRGPASSLYGGVSLTAVVNVITKQGIDVDGVEVRAGAGNYGQIKADMIFGKRYFDLDLLIWGSLYRAKGETVFMPVEDTGMQMTDGDITIGSIGRKPSYDVGVQLKYKNLQFLYNTQSSRVISPVSMSYTFSPYTPDKYRTFNGIGPSFSTLAHHANLSYGQQVGNVYLKGSVNYDNGDLTHYQILNEPVTSAMLGVLPIPDHLKVVMDGNPGIARYINGQEHTFGGKVQGEWNYVNNANHQGQLSFGAEYSYFQLDDVEYVYTYDFNKIASDDSDIAKGGKGHESNMNGFMQLKHHWRSFILNAGLRFDYKNRFDETKIREFSPRLALIYVQPKWNLKLSYSKSFIDAPYLYRKTNLIVAYYLGADEEDSDILEPETLHSFQLTFGTNQWLPGLNVEVNGFYNIARDLIYQYVAEHYNTGNYNTYGIELSADYQRRSFTAHVNATWQGVSRAELFDITFGHSLSTPDFSANAVLAWQATKNLKLRTHVDFKSRQHVFYLDILEYGAYRTFSNLLREFKEAYAIDPTPENKEMVEFYEQVTTEKQNDVPVFKEIGSRVLFDLGATYQWRNLTFDLDVKNIFNRKYAQSGVSTGLIPQRGRWFLATVGYKF
jgi:iron complex outermembrane receptor protein